MCHPLHTAKQCHRSPTELQHALASWVLEVLWETQTQSPTLWSGMACRHLRLEDIVVHLTHWHGKQQHLQHSSIAPHHIPCLGQAQLLFRLWIMLLLLHTSSHHLLKNHLVVANPQNHSSVTQNPRWRWRLKKTRAASRRRLHLKGLRTFHWATLSCKTRI